MSDWGTLRQNLVDQAGDGRDADDVQRAMVDAIAHESSEHYFFNEQRFSFATVDGQQTYGTADGVPVGIVSFISQWLFLDVGQDADDRHPIRKETMQWIDTARAGASAGDQPEAWAYFDEKIELWPDPGSTTHDVRGRVVVQPGVPSYVYSGGSWSFKKPDGTAMTDDYPDSGSGEANAWLTDDQAYRVIRSYAEYLLYSGTWHATKNQDQKALQRYLEFKEKLEDRMATHRPHRIEPYPLGRPVYWEAAG